MAFEIGRAVVSILPDMKAFGPALAARIQASGTAAAGAGGMKAGAVFGAAFVGAAVAGGALVKLGSDFQESFSTIRVGTGATGEALEGLKDTFKSVYASTSGDMNGVANVVKDLNTRLGLTGAPLEALSKQIVDLAEITGGDAQASVESISRWFGDWGIATEDQTAALDSLFRASQATGPSVERLAQLSVKFGAPLRQFGFTFDEVAVMMGKFEKEGVNTELVMGSMRQALAKFAGAGRDPREAFMETVSAIQGMSSEADRVGLAMDVFGRRAGPDMAAAIYEGRFEIDELFDTVANGTDTIEGLQDETQSIGSTLKEFGNTIRTAVEPAATKLFETVRSVIRSAGPVVEAFGQALNVVATAMSAIPGPVYIVAGAIVTFVTSFLLIVKAVALVKAAFATLGAIMAANPVVLILLAIVAAVYLLWRNWSTVTRWLGNAWRWFSNVVATVWRAISGVLKAVGGFLYDWVIRPVVFVFKLWQKYWSTIFGVVTWVWNAITATIAAAWNWIVDTITTAVDAIWTVVDTVWNGIASTISTVGETIKSAAAGAFDWIIDKLDKIRDFAGKVGDKFSKAFDTVVDWVTKAKDKTVEFLQAVWDKLKEVKDWVSTQTSSDGWIGKLVGRATDAVSWAWRNMNPVGRVMNAFASGGRATPGMGPVLVGEKGPELVTFQRAGRVIPSDESLRMLTAQSDSGVTVAGPLLSITGDVVIRSERDISELSRQLAKEVNVRARAAGDSRPFTGASL